MTVPLFQFTDRCYPVVEIGIGASATAAGAARWDVSFWDEPASTWAGNEPIWRDVSCFAFESSIDIGRGRVSDPFPVGTAEILIDNSTGWADPVIIDAPTALTVRPGRPIRSGIVHATLGTVWLFRGFIDAVDPDYDAELPDVVSLRCIDALGEAGRAKVASTTVVGTGEGCGQRFNRILNAAKWSGVKREVDTSPIPLVGAALDGQIVDMLRRTADSAGGHAFGDTNGDVVFRNRDWMLYEADDPDNGTIGNGVDGAVCPSSWRRPFDRAGITTRVILDRALPAGDPDTDPLTLDDTVGQRTYGIEPFSLTDLWTRDDDDLYRIGSRILATRNSVTMPRVESVTVSAPAATVEDTEAVVDLLTALDPFLPSRYRCRLELPRGEVFDASYFATGVRHTITAEEWVAEISLDRSEVYEIDPNSAEWDVALWDRAYWAA